MLACRGIVVTYETIRQWCLKLTLSFAKSLRKKQGALGDQWFLDEVFIKINGKQHYLWRAVDQDGCELDILLTKKRDKRSAVKFFKKLFKGQNQQPRKITTDKFASYKAALRDLGCKTPHITRQYKNNIAEISQYASPRLLYGRIENTSSFNLILKPELLPNMTKIDEAWPHRFICLFNFI